MKIHVVLDEELDVVAYVPVTDTYPQVAIEPLRASHTLHEHVEVSDVLAELRGVEAVDHVRAHMRRHLS